MKLRHLSLILALTATGCTTMNESLQLGGALGGATGMAATMTAYGAVGKSPPIGSMALGAGIGSAVGLLSAYLIHNKVTADRASLTTDQTEMHFGDLPPSPFIVPRNPQKGAQ